MKIVIMAGGGGTRLWPLSRNVTPKQLQAIIGDRTLLQQTVGRISGEFSADDIYIATRDEYVKDIKKQLPEIPTSHYIIEPQKADTAAAMGYVSAVLSKKFGDEALAFLPSDHNIKDNDLFVKSLRVAEKIILSEGKMVDIGVVPTFPSTNLGYTQVGKKINTLDGIDIHEFLGHTEKPPLDVAKKYLNDGSYLWHASYYMWTPNKFLDAFEVYAPDMHKHLMKIHSALGTPKEQKVIDRVFEDIERISFDYAITEKMNLGDVRILPAKFHWSDVGTWSIVKQEQQENAEANVIKGENVSIDTENCLIYSTKGKTIATVGLEDMIIVDTEDALLICPMDRDQEVKKIVEMLKEDGKEDTI